MIQIHPPALEANELVEVFIRKKLRDVLQEREGTSLNYFEVFYNYIEPFLRPSRSILLYLI